MPPRRVVLLRHAEKPDDLGDRDLSPAGRARAQGLAQVIPARFPGPDFLFAAAPSEKSNRPVETLQPLSDAIGLAVGQDVRDDDYPDLTSELLEDAAYAGRLIVVCWHHGNLPGLAVALGASAADVAAAPEMGRHGWRGEVFDRFWILDFESGGVAFQSQPQNVPGLA